MADEANTGRHEDPAAPSGTPRPPATLGPETRPIPIAYEPTLPVPAWEPDGVQQLPPPLRQAPGTPVHHLAPEPPAPAEPVVEHYRDPFPEPYRQPDTTQPWPGRPEPAGHGPSSFPEPGPVTDGPPSGRGGILAKFAGKAGWNLADQILSSLTNIALTIIVAHSVNHDETKFGAYSTAFFVFALFIAVGRALVGQPLSIRHSNETDESMRLVAARALGTTAVLAVPAGVVVVLVGLAVGGAARGALIAVGCMLLPLLLQDAVRMVFFARSRPELATLNDFVWAVVQFGAMGALILAGFADVVTLILAWGLSAAVGVGLALVQLRVVPSPGATAGWVREHRDLLAYLLPETLTTSGGDKAAYFGVTPLIGLKGIGAVNGARSILNPMLIVSGAVTSFTIPEISRRQHLSRRTRVVVGLGIGAAMAVATLVFLGILLLFPRIGLLVLDSTVWAGAQQVLVPMGLFSAAAGFCLGPFLVIAAMGHAKRSFRVTVLQTVLTLVFMPLGAWLEGAPGAAWGLLAGKLIEIPFWVGTLLTVVRLGPVPHPEDDEVVAH